MVVLLTNTLDRRTIYEDIFVPKPKHKNEQPEQEIMRECTVTIVICVFLKSPDIR